MRASTTIAAALVGAAIAGAPAMAQTITLSPSNTNTTGGGAFIANDTRIQFNTGNSVVATLPSVPGQSYQLTLSGQNANNFRFTFEVDRDGAGTGVGFQTLLSNVDFGNGFNSLTLPSFTDLGTSDFLRITGNGNGSGQIATTITLAAIPVPGPLAGVGLVPLFGLAGAWFVRRRKQKLAA